MTLTKVLSLLIGLFLCHMTIASGTEGQGTSGQVAWKAKRKPRLWRLQKNDGEHEGSGIDCFVDRSAIHCCAFRSGRQLHRSQNGGEIHTRLGPGRDPRWPRDQGEGLRL